MKRHPQESKYQYGRRLIVGILATFDSAYLLHEQGQSEQALLITHDILAAASDTDPIVIAGHRKAVRSACQAVDAGVPLPLAHAVMFDSLHQALQENCVAQLPRKRGRSA